MDKVATKIIKLIKKFGITRILDGGLYRRYFIGENVQIVPQQEYMHIIYQGTALRYFHYTSSEWKKIDAILNKCVDDRIVEIEREFLAIDTAHKKR